MLSMSEMDHPILPNSFAYTHELFSLEDNFGQYEEKIKICHRLSSFRGFLK